MGGGLEKGGEAYVSRGKAVRSEIRHTWKTRSLIFSNEKNGKSTLHNSVCTARKVHTVV